MRQLVLTAALFMASACAKETSHDHEADRAALYALDQAYVEGWKQSGAAAQDKAVMAIFAEDAIIRPGLGTPPRKGADEIRAFWFPPDTPATRIIKFDHAPDSITVEHDLGVVSGWYELRFEYGGDEYAQNGNYLTVARRQPDNEWRVTQMIWNDNKLE